MIVQKTYDELMDKVRRGEMSLLEVMQIAEQRSKKEIVKAIDNYLHHLTRKNK